MKRIQVIVFVVLFAVISCSKDKDLSTNTTPIDTIGFKALFHVEYNADSPDVVYCYNLSTNFKKLKWVFSDNTSSLETNPTHIFELNTNSNRNITLIAEDETGKVDSFMVNFQVHKGYPDFYYNAHVSLINIDPVTYSIYRDDGYFGAKVDFVTYSNGSKIDTLPYSKGMQITLNNNSLANNFRLHTIQKHESIYVSKFINIPTLNFETLLEHTSKIPNQINFYERFKENTNKTNGSTNIINYSDSTLNIEQSNGTYINIKDTKLGHEFRGYVCFRKEAIEKSKPNIIRFMVPGSSMLSSSSSYVKYVDFNFITREILACDYNEYRIETIKIIYKGN